MGAVSIREGRKAKCEWQCLPLLIADHRLWHDEGEGEWLLSVVALHESFPQCTWLPRMYAVCVCATPLQQED